MKKLFSLIVILIAFTGCSDEVSVPAPGFQAFKDDALWRGEDFKAYIYPDGHMRIVGYSGFEQVELNLADSDIGSYYMASTDDANFAGYTTPFDNQVLHYLTYDANGPIPSINNPMLTAGSNYHIGFSIATSSTGGGTGMRVNTNVDDDGAVKGVTISSPGFGYEPGDIITVTGGDNNARFKILSEVQITGYSETGVSGTFRFTAKRAEDNPFTNQLVSFQYGAFYNVPVTLVE